MPGSRSGPLPSNSLAQTRFSATFLPRSAFPTTFEPGTGYKVVRALAAHLCGPGSNSGVEAICGSLLLVFSFAARGFYLGTPVFQFTICISPTIHLVCLSPKFCITSVFQFSWVFQPSQEKLKTMLMQNFGGQTRCIMGDVQMANSNWTRNQIDEGGLVQDSHSFEFFKFHDFP